MFLVTPQVKMSPLSDDLLGANIDLPASGTRSSFRSLTLAGWVVGREGVVTEVRILSVRNKGWRVRLSQDRPDVNVHLNGVPGAMRSGFLATIDISRIDDEVLHVSAVLADGRSATIGTVELHRSWRSGTHVSERGVVSVVIPCFNQGHLVSDAIDSCLAQSYPQIEIVVVDDGSTDNTQEVVRRYNRVRLVQQANAGLSAARNTGIRTTNGEYLMFVDADDRLVPDGVRLNVDLLKACEACAFVSGDHCYIDIDGQRTETWVRPVVDRHHYEAFLRTNYIGCPAAVTYRRAALRSAGGFDTGLGACEDYDIYLRIARQFPVQSHGGLVAEYRRHGDSMSRNRTVMLESAISVLRRQRPWVKGSSSRRKALAEGFRSWGGRYGPEIAALAFQDLKTRDRRLLGIAGLIWLARHAPRQLSRALTACRLG